jgi:hypothetical protein
MLFYISPAEDVDLTKNLTSPRKYIYNFQLNKTASQSFCSDKRHGTNVVNSIQIMFTTTIADV